MSKALTPSDGKKTKSGFLLSDGLTPRSPNVSRNSSLSSPHTSAKKPSSDPRQTNAATPDSNEALQEPEQPVEPGEHQLFLEDIVKQGKKLMLVKIPPGVCTFEDCVEDFFPQNIAVELVHFGSRSRSLCACVVVTNQSINRKQALWHLFAVITFKLHRYDWLLDWGRSCCTLVFCCRLMCRL